MFLMFFFFFLVITINFMIICICIYLIHYFYCLIVFKTANSSILNNANEDILTLFPLTHQTGTFQIGIYFYLRCNDSSSGEYNVSIDNAFGSSFNYSHCPGLCLFS
jgi:hypothetical protein